MISKDLDYGDIIAISLYKNIVNKTNFKKKTMNQLLNEYKNKNDDNDYNYNNIDKNEEIQLKSEMFGVLNDNNIKEKTKKINKVNNNEMKFNDEICMILARSFGRLEICIIPTFELIFSCNELHIGHNILVNNIIHDESLNIISSKQQLAKRKKLLQFMNA